MSTNASEIGTFTFNGRLCGYICSECPEPLSRVKVRLYRTRKEQDVTERAVANPKETFAILSDEEVKAKQSSLIAEAETDEQGNFSFQLDRKKYGGEAFEVDGYCGTVPHRKPIPNPPPPVQFSITTIRPMWRRGETGAVAVWEYCIPYRYWCAVRSRFGAWVICGIVTDCKQHAPIAGVRVRAFDVDWLQDDPIGSAITDTTGRFRIDYATEDFTRTPFSPFINFECVSGPDLYFRVETSSGTILLNEPRLRGRAPDRENVGQCFCVDLCLEGTPPPSTHTIPIFRKVGIYNVDPLDPDFGTHGFTADGVTNPGNLAFTGTIKLRGALPNGDSTPAMKYHFRVGEYDSTGTVLGAVSDIEADKIAPTVIGALEYWDWNSTLSIWQHRLADWWANNPGVAPITVHTPGGPLPPVSRNINVDPGGWIRVPTLNDFSFGGQGWFVGGSDVNLIELMTTKLTDESFDLIAPPPVLHAGASVPAPKKSRKHRFRIFFAAQTLGGGSVSSNDREKIALSNTHYRQRRHPNWPESTPDPTLIGVVSVDIQELAAPGAGCEHLHNELHAQFTAYHPFAAAGILYFEGPVVALPTLGAPFALTLSADGEAASGLGGHLFDLSAEHPCAYILWMEVDFSLTDGWTFFGTSIWDHLAFCKV